MHKTLYAVMVRQHFWSTFRQGCWTFLPTSTYFSVNKVCKQLDQLLTSAT